MNSTNHVLNYHLGQENRIVIENEQERKTSIFSSQYDKCLDIVEQLKSRNSGYEQEPGVCENIITITGDRGCGKTSFMQTVAGQLKEREEYHCIPMIDPAYFNSESNLISMIIGILSQEFNVHVRGSRLSCLDYNSQKAKENRLLEVSERMSELQKVLTMMDSFKYKKGEEQFYDLADLASAMSLRVRLKDLVGAILREYGKRYLVIQIDDIDLDSKICCTMMEQIRKYLTLENVIVFVSVKISQALDAVKLGYVDEYVKIYPRDTDAVVGEIAQRYLDKLFPARNRINLPSAIPVNSQILVSEPNGQRTQSNIAEYISGKICEKTGYHFHVYNGICRIIPSNLRSFNQLLSILLRMEDEESARREFKLFFAEHWVPDHVPYEKQKWVLDLLCWTDFPDMNKNVARKLSELFHGQNELWVERIINPKNNKMNISIGDILSLIKELERTSSDRLISNYLYAIEAVYTFHLADHVNEATNSAGQISVLKHIDDDRRMPIYHQIVNGNYFNAEYSLMSRFLQPGRTKLAERTVTRVNTKQIKSALLSGVCAAEDVVLAEIVSLFLARPRSPKDATENASYRRDEIYYLTSFENSDLPIFDASSFFYNVLVLEDSYKRFSGDLLEIANKTAGSLINKIKQNNIIDEPFVDFETISDFADYLSLNSRSSQHSGNTFYEQVMNLMKRAGDVTIKNNVQWCSNVANLVFESMNNFSKSAITNFNDLYDKRDIVIKTLDIPKIVSRMNDQREYPVEILRNKVIRHYPFFNDDSGYSNLLNNVVNKPMNKETFTQSLIALDAVVSRLIY